MTATINESRIQCQTLLSRGACFIPVCPYNHDMRSSVDSAKPKSDTTNRQTGHKGQFVGSVKGGNSVPIRITGEIPAFLQSRLGQKAPTVASATETNPPFDVFQQGFYGATKPEGPPRPPYYGSPDTQPPTRTGGNEQIVRPTGILAYIPAQRERKVEKAPIDWKAAALSKLSTPAKPERRTELEQELSRLKEEESSKRVYLSQVNEEIAQLSKRRDFLMSEGSGVNDNLIMHAGSQLADWMERCDSAAHLFEAEREKSAHVCEALEKTGLVDMHEIRQAQALFLKEIATAVDRYRKLSDHVQVEFKAIVYAARRSNS